MLGFCLQGVGSSARFQRYSDCSPYFYTARFLRVDGYLQGCVRVVNGCCFGVSYPNVFLPNEPSVILDSIGHLDSQVIKISKMNEAWACKRFSVKFSLISSIRGTIARILPRWIWKVVRSIIHVPPSTVQTHVVFHPWRRIKWRNSVNYVLECAAVRN